MAVESGWKRRVPYVELDRPAIERLIDCAVLDVSLLTGGLRNTNYALQLETERAVLRLYSADAAACRREMALLRLVADRAPVPRVLRADPTATPPWALLEWMPGVRFDEMLFHATSGEVEQACHAAGDVLARIHAVTFDAPAMLGPGLELAEPMGQPWLTGVAEFFRKEHSRQLVGKGLAQEVERLVEREAWRLADCWAQAQLVPADYKPWNLLVDRVNSTWRVSAVLDWEFAFSGPALCDLGIFLRYSARMPREYERGFLAGYGADAAETRDLARLIVLVSLWTFLERAAEDPQVVADVRPLLVETVNAFKEVRRSAVSRKSVTR